jgi:putative flavoprotein involved in K+ transport
MIGPARPGLVATNGFEVEAAGAVRACRNVVLCTGDQNCPSIPSVAERLPDGVTQLHIVEYRRPAQLPAGGVLVVGSGQSGVQVVEDLGHGLPSSLRLPGSGAS